jgi:hypothetical protein
MPRTSEESDGDENDGVISVGDGEQATAYDQPTIYALNGARTDSANEISHFLGEMASLVKAGNHLALFKLCIRSLDSKEPLLAKAFLSFLTEKYPDLYGVANLQLARLLRDERNFSKAEEHYISADFKGCSPALPELEKMRELPDYPPKSLNVFLEAECIKKALENMRPGKFQLADKFLHRAILNGSTKALALLKHMRVDMHMRNLYY